MEVAILSVQTDDPFAVGLPSPSLSFLFLPLPQGSAFPSPPLVPFPPSRPSSYSFLIPSLPL